MAGAFKKKATRALKSAKSWFRSSRGKSASSVDLASEVSAREDSGSSVSTPGLGKEEGPVLFEDSQGEASPVGSQAAQSSQGGMRRIRSSPRIFLSSWGDDAPALKLVKSLARLPTHHSRDSSFEDWSPRPAKRMPSSSDQDSVPEPPCPSPTPREFPCEHKEDSDASSCPELPFTMNPNQIQEICS